MQEVTEVEILSIPLLDLPRVLQEKESSIRVKEKKRKRIDWTS